MLFLFYTLYIVVMKLSYTIVQILIKKTERRILMVSLREQIISEIVESSVFFMIGLFVAGIIKNIL